MEFPKEHLGYSDTHGSKPSDNGWLILDVRTLDMEGVTKVYVNLDDVEAVKERKAQSESEADRLRKLLGG